MELYFSVDVETDGPIPGPNSMLSFGAAAFLRGQKKPVDTWISNLEILPGAMGDPETMAWWKHSDRAAAWKACRENPAKPEEELAGFVDWVERISKTFGAEPVFVAYPAGFDFLFIYWYMMKFVGRSPFSFSALDIKSFAMSLLKLDYRNCTKRNFPKKWFAPNTVHTHIALDDAIEQGMMFMNMLEDTR